MMNYFSQFGEIKDIALAKHYKTERFLGFATVEFQSKDGVFNSLAVQKHIICGKTIKCKMKLLKSEIEKTRPRNTKYGLNSIRINTSSTLYSLNQKSSQKFLEKQKTSLTFLRPDSRRHQNYHPNN